MKNVVSLVALLLLLSACGNQLRKPFCPNNLKSLPSEFQGSYEVTMPALSATWSGNMILKTVAFTLNADSITTSAPVDMMPSWGQGCLIQGRYFVENRNANGTYTIGELSRFSGGIVFSLLSIDLDRAQKMGFPLHYLPKNATQSSDSGGLSLSFDVGGFILDNSHLTPEQVLAVTQAVSIQTVLRTSGDPSKLWTRTELRLTPQGIVKH